MGLVAGITGGVVLVSAQVARRTGTAYDRLQHAVHAPDALLIAPDLGSARKVLALPMVKKGWLVGTAIGQLGHEQVQYVGITAGPHAPPKGLFTPIVVRGRAANPRVSDEAVITEHAAQVTGLGPGDDLPLAFLTPLELTQFDTGFGEPDGPKVTLHIVGTILGAIEAGLNAPEVFSTPAFARRLGENGLTAGGGFAQLRDGSKSLPAYQRAVRKLNRSLGPRTGAEEFVGVEVQVPGRQRPVAAATARVLDIGVGVFAAIAAIAGGLALLLILRRHFATAGLDPDALSAVGVTRGATRAARVLTTLLMVLVGVVVAGSRRASIE